MTGRAETYLDDAQRYLEVVPEQHGNRLSAWAIPYLLAVGTMRELRERPEDVVREGDVKVPRAEVYALLQQFEEESHATDLPTFETRWQRNRSISESGVSSRRWLLSVFQVSRYHSYS